MTLPELPCEHCGLVLHDVTVHVLPMACPGCGAPLLALCRMSGEGGRMVWKQTPAFPETVDV